MVDWGSWKGREGYKPEFKPKKMRLTVSSASLLQAEAQRLTATSTMNVTFLPSECALSADEALSSATVVMPVCALNFGESLLGSFETLARHRQSGRLLLAGARALDNHWTKERLEAAERAHERMLTDYPAEPFWREAIDIIWSGARVEPMPRVLVASKAGADANDANKALRFGSLSLCELRSNDHVDGFSAIQPSVLGERLRARLPATRIEARPVAPLAIGLISAGEDYISNQNELLARCRRRGHNCTLLSLNARGMVDNALRVQRLHAMVGVHGAHITFSAFARRPFAFLEIKPYAHASVSTEYFVHYHQVAFTRDTWVYAYHGTVGVTRRASSLNRFAFDAFLRNVSDRFKRHAEGLPDLGDGRAQRCVPCGNARNCSTASCRWEWYRPRSCPGGSRNCSKAYKLRSGRLINVT